MENRGPRAERLEDAGMVAGAGLLSAVLLLGELSDGAVVGALRLAVEGATWVIASAALVLVRRRRPTALAIALLPFGVISTGAMGAAAMAVLNLALRRRWQVTVSVAAAHAVAVIVAFRQAIPDTRDYVTVVVVLLALHVALIAVGMVVRSHRLLVASLRERAHQAEERQRLQIADARHHERERIAREMHDVLAHRISLLAVHAGALEVRTGAPAAERRAAEVIRASAHEALDDLHDVIDMLRSAEQHSDDRPQPTLHDVEDIAAESRGAGMRVTVDDRVVDAHAMPPAVGRHVHRVVQEALTNARKHAPGGDVRVVLTGTPTVGVTVDVVNSVPRPTAGSGSGLGLVGLRERLDLLGGRLEHGPMGDGTFRLRAWVPCRT